MQRPPARATAAVTGGTSGRRIRGISILKTARGDAHMFGEIGIEKILLIMVVVLLLFGAKRIPEIGSSIGRGIREFKRSVNDLQNDVHTSDLPAPPRDTRPLAPRPDSDPTPRADDTGSEPKRLLM
jgi:sec-independent protein translocase protein TatA